MIFLHETVRNTLYYLSTVHISQNKIHNLQIRLEQLTDQTKKLKKHQLAGIALSIHDNTKSSQTQILRHFRHMSQTCCAIYRTNS